MSIKGLFKSDGKVRLSATKEPPAKSHWSASHKICPCGIKTSTQAVFFVAVVFFVFYSCKMDMSSLHNGETWWHFPGCSTLNQRDQQYVECQHGDIWVPFHSCGITAGMPADITVLPSWRWACQTFHSTSMFSETIYTLWHVGSFLIFPLFARCLT